MKVIGYFTGFYF